jgi:hypothetical protein
MSVLPQAVESDAYAQEVIKQAKRELIEKYSAKMSTADAHLQELKGSSSPLLPFFPFLTRQIEITRSNPSAWGQPVNPFQSSNFGALEEMTDGHGDAGSAYTGDAREVDMIDMGAVGAVGVVGGMGDVINEDRSMEEVAETNQSEKTDEKAMDREEPQSNTETKQTDASMAEAESIREAPDSRAKRDGQPQFAVSTLRNGEDQYPEDYDSHHTYNSDATDEEREKDTTRQIENAKRLHYVQFVEGPPSKAQQDTLSYKVDEEEQEKAGNNEQSVLYLDSFVLQ